MTEFRRDPLKLRTDASAQKRRPVLSPRGHELLEQWKRSHPQAVKRLQRSGDLERSLNYHLEREAEVFGQAIEQGLNPDQAREIALQELDLPGENSD